MKSRRISTRRFEQQCAALLRDVERTGRALTVTRNGRAIARIEPVRANRRSLEGNCGDIVSPTGEW